MTPQVSVVVTAYNVAPFIAETLDSIFAQSFQDFEVIVVNDGSPDTGTLELALRPYRARINYIVRPNGGPSAARNDGIRVARAPLVAGLDGDDVWERDYLSVMVSALNADPTLDAMFSNARFFGYGSLVGHECMSLNPVEGEVTFEKVVSLKCNVLGFVTARREILIDAGLYDETLRSSEDFEFWTRILKHGGRIGYTRQILAGYRRHDGSSSADPESMYRSAVHVYDKIARRDDLTPPERHALMTQRQRFAADLRFTEGKKAFFRGDIDRALAGMSEANAVYRSRKVAAALMLLRVAPRLMLRAYDLRDRLLFGTTTRV